ncbi:hypothetical protein BDFG_07142 [Blastomyces dermatitidis ATCC 26199]|nr:hypothetical protein BDFG_07142 [Blastomyces dermatitidis ATCC 26199]
MEWDGMEKCDSGFSEASGGDIPPNPHQGTARNLTFFPFSSFPYSFLSFLALFSPSTLACSCEGAPLLYCTFPVSYVRVIGDAHFKAGLFGQRLSVACYSWLGAGEEVAGMRL